MRGNPLEHSLKHSFERPVQPSATLSLQRGAFAAPAGLDGMRACDAFVVHPAQPIE